MSHSSRDNTQSDPADAPHPEDERKPDSPAEITKPTWKYILRTTIREFSADGCTDLAAGLTYRTVLSIFPALIAVVSVLSLFGQGGGTVTAVLDQAEGIVPSDTWGTVRPALESVLTAPAPGLGLILGLLAALWSASSYVKAFGRVMNVIHEVPEGRGGIKLNVQMYLLTALILVLGAVALLILVLSGPVAEAVGSAIGLGSTAVTVWSIAQWFVLAFVVVSVVALLYYATPNVQQPKFRWVSVGALIAIVVAVLASVGFFFYVSNFGNYNATYGALAGVIILLLWIYIVNAILLFGAEVDSEVERGRELQAGMPAEENLQLPARDTKASDKKAKKHQEDVGRARNLRRSAGRSQDEPAVGTDEAVRR
ncbi:YihY/virulence factor BrkB family protein [Nesterenkonia aurantiaca]|uniref:Membrane protein n=1 Tax=Nesterenkonia aurantiaca TaxID=1436010 RepID=A0A4R7FY46_9MICC|nr:YihY/virulence factor BrkB family protein [Nesterenkonia aurantiaca]TDS83718.1 membrane protein [Nesterenkonia aurantiaca]